MSAEITKENWDGISLNITRLPDDSVIVDFKGLSRVTDMRLFATQFSLGLCDIEDAVPRIWELFEGHYKKCDEGFYKNPAPDEEDDRTSP